MAGRRPHLALAHDEEVRRVAGRDEAVRIEHQRLVGAGLCGLDAGGDAVELAVAVELRILHVRIAAAHVHGEQRQRRARRVSGSGSLCSGMITIVAGPIDHARILVRRAT